MRRFGEVQRRGEGDPWVAMVLSDKRNPKWTSWDSQIEMLTLIEGVAERSYPFGVPFTWVVGHHHWELVRD